MAFGAASRSRSRRTRSRSRSWRSSTTRSCSLIPGAMDAGLDSVLFWGSLASRSLIAGAAAYPGQPLADRPRHAATRSCTRSTSTEEPLSARSRASQPRPVPWVWSATQEVWMEKARTFDLRPVLVLAAAVFAASRGVGDDGARGGGGSSSSSGSAGGSPAAQFVQDAQPPARRGLPGARRLRRWQRGRRLRRRLERRLGQHRRRPVRLTRPYGAARDGGPRRPSRSVPWRSRRLTGRHACTCVCGTVRGPRSCSATGRAAAWPRPISSPRRGARGGLGLAVVLVEQPYRVAGRRSPAPAHHLDAAWTAVLEHLRGGPLAGCRSSSAAAPWAPGSRAGPRRRPERPPCSASRSRCGRRAARGRRPRAGCRSSTR